MTKKRNQPKIVLLSKGPKNKNSVLTEFLNNNTMPEIPVELLDGIFVTLNSGEKYKINKEAIKKGVNCNNVLEQLSSIGVPDNINAVEIVLDTPKAEKTIENQAKVLFKNAFK